MSYNAQKRNRNEDNFNNQARELPIIGKVARFNYSSGDKVNRNMYDAEDQRVLLFTVINPQYPITVHVMHTICSEHGEISRIVVFKKNGLQVLVEFVNAEGASKAKHELNGADIYSNCCTLKIEYAKTDKLNVGRNNDDSWDYTLGHKEYVPPTDKSLPLLESPRYDNNESYSSANRGGDYGSNGHSSRYQDHSFQTREPFDNRRHGGHSEVRFPGRRPLPGYNSPVGCSNGQGEVYMIYQLAGFNCHKLFNLLCLYGNVYKIKMLKSKEGSAMVQMELDDRLYLLNGVECNGSKISMKLSTQQDLKPVANPIAMDDGSPSYIDFSTDKNNRFLNATAASKNRLEISSKTLYYFNGSPEMSEETMAKISDEVGAKRFFKFTKFPCKAESLATGLIEYDSADDATSALILMNHYTIPNPDGKYPFVLKFCFSQKKITIPKNI